VRLSLPKQGISQARLEADPIAIYADRSRGQIIQSGGDREKVPDEIGCHERDIAVSYAESCPPVADLTEHALLRLSNRHQRIDMGPYSNEEKGAE